MPRFNITFTIEAESFEEADKFALDAIDQISNLHHENGEGKTYRVTKTIEELEPLTAVNKARDAEPG